MFTQRYQQPKYGYLLSLCSRMWKTTPNVIGVFSGLRPIFHPSHLSVLNHCSRMCFSGLGEPNTHHPTTLMLNGWVYCKLWHKTGLYVGHYGMFHHWFNTYSLHLLSFLSNGVSNQTKHSTEDESPSLLFLPKPSASGSTDRCVKTARVLCYMKKRFCWSEHIDHQITEV